MEIHKKVKAIPWDLILKSLKNDANLEDSQQLNEWIEENDQHRRLLNELQHAWDDISHLNSAYTPDSLKAWQQVVEKTKERYQKPSRKFHLLWRVAAAACVLALLGIAISNLTRTSSPPSLTYTQYTTQDDKSFVTLPDGTQVWLNAHTTLTFSNLFNKSLRHVEVHGEALFDVTHHPDIPFEVGMNHLQVRVHGTKFNVQSYDDEPVTAVTLLEGSVSLGTTGHDDIHLKPGITAVYDKTNTTLTLNPSDPLATLWASRELHIEDKSLEETAQILEHWFRMRIEVAPALKNTHYYTFTVRHESVTDMLELMQRISKFNYKMEEQKIIIY